MNVFAAKKPKYDISLIYIYMVYTRRMIQTRFYGPESFTNSKEMLSGSFYLIIVRKEIKF
jgi:hypothetical protein